jgi:hypothetical protein
MYVNAHPIKKASEEFGTTQIELATVLQICLFGTENTA